MNNEPVLVDSVLEESDFVDREHWLDHAISRDKACSVAQQAIDHLEAERCREKLNAHAITDDDDLKRNLERQITELDSSIEYWDDYLISSDNAHRIAWNNLSKIALMGRVTTSRKP